MAITTKDPQKIISATGLETTRGRRFKYGLSVGVLLLSIAFILVILNWGASSYARRFDLTAGRAYSLSPQTQAILESLEYKCTLTLLFAENDPKMTEAEQARARAARGQVEDVLREFDQRSELIEIRRIDPTDHRAKAKIEALYEGLKESRKELIAEYEARLEEARGAVAAVNAFLQNELLLGGDQLGMLDQSHQQWRQFRQIQQAVAGLPGVLDRLVAQADESLVVGIGRPLPDWEQARSILVSAFGEPASTFEEIARICRAVAAEDNSLPAEFVATLEPMALRFSAQADQLLNMRDRLVDLEAINLSRLVRRIATQDCVLLSDETDTFAIPFNSLFPMPSLEEMQRGALLDRRFAGERVISTALRRLTIKEPSTVVICHAEPGNPLQGRSQGVANIAAVTEQVRDLGFEVKVWDVVRGERPEVQGNEFGHPVWVILPPRPNPGAPESAQNGAVLADIAQDLVESGERVMMNFWPSPMVGFGQPDYWNTVTKSLGVRADSGKQVFQQIPVPDGRSRSEAFVEVNEYSKETLLGEALNGMATIFTSPVPLLLAGEVGFDETADGVAADPPNDAATGDAIKRWVVADITPTKLLWVEENWMQGATGIQPPAEVATEPVHLVVAVERGLQNGTQRCLVVGSVYWFDDYPVLLSNQAAGGILFAYPGNAELFASGICWLAGIDELIAPSAMTQTVARISGLGSGAMLTYRILLIAVLPLISLGFGVGVWYLRRG